LTATQAVSTVKAVLLKVKLEESSTLVSQKRKSKLKWCHNVIEQKSRLYERYAVCVTSGERPQLEYVLPLVGRYRKIAYVLPLVGR
jgi:hypothetical protein